MFQPQSTLYSIYTSRPLQIHLMISFLLNLSFNPYPSSNFNSLSSYIPIACQTFSITCSMSLASPLFILFLYSYLSTLHIPILIMSLVYVFFIFRFYVFYCILCTITYIISFLIYHNYFAYFLSLAYIVYLIYFILFLVSCSLQVSYAFMSRILLYNLSYTILYVYLHSYTFHILFFHLSFICL